MGVENLEYSVDGELFSYTTSNSLKIYAAANGMLRNIISLDTDNMKYFQKNTLLHTKDSLIYYLSIYDNKHLRKFDAHKDTIKGLSVSSYDDLFMSVGTKKTNIWDIRYKDPIRSIQSNGKLGALSQDQEYTLADNNFMYIFDRRNDRGPLVVKDLKPNFYKSILYTMDNSCIAISSSKEHVFTANNGEFLSSCTAENDTVGDTMSDSNIFVYTSSNFIFAYNILDKKRIGRTKSPESQHSSLKACHNSSQFITTSNLSLSIYNLVL